jgi:hypothetical protein
LLRLAVVVLLFIQKMILTSIHCTTGGQLGVERKWSKDSIVMNVRGDTIDNFRLANKIEDEITFLKVDAEGKDVMSESFYFDAI